MATRGHCYSLKMLLEGGGSVCCDIYAHTCVGVRDNLPLIHSPPLSQVANPSLDFHHLLTLSPPSSLFPILGQKGAERSKKTQQDHETNIESKDIPQDASGKTPRCRASRLCYPIPFLCPRPHASPAPDGDASLLCKKMVPSPWEDACRHLPLKREL